MIVMQKRGMTKDIFFKGMEINKTETVVKYSL